MNTYIFEIMEGDHILPNIQFEKISGEFE